MYNQFPVGKVKICATNLIEATNGLIEQAGLSRSFYVCVTNVRTAYLANRDAYFTLTATIPPANFSGMIPTTSRASIEFPINQLK